MQNLLTKSDNSLKTARIAEQVKLFDNAVSRHYYALYQKIIFLSPPCESVPVGMDSHNTTLESFITCAKDLRNKGLLPPEDFRALLAIKAIKRARTAADYTADFLTEDKYLSLHHTIDSVTSAINQIQNIIEHAKGGRVNGTSND